MRLIVTSKSSSEVALMIKVGLVGSDVTPAYRHGFIVGLIPSEGRKWLWGQMPCSMTVGDQTSVGSIRDVEMSSLSAGSTPSISKRQEEGSTVIFNDKYLI
jgi:hypothetical protein